MNFSTLFKASVLSVVAYSVVGCNDPQASVTQTTTTDTQNAQTSVNQAQSKSTATTSSVKYVSPLPDDAPIYKVATESSYEPFVSQDTNGHLQGLDVDLIRAIGESQGFKVEIYAIPWSDVYPGLQLNKYDIGMSGIHIKPEMMEKFAMSDPYLQDKVQIVTKAGSSIGSAEDLDGKIVGAQSGTVHEKLARKISGATVEVQPSVFKAFQQLVLNKSDAFLSDKSIALHFAGEFPEMTINYHDLDDNSHKIGFYFNKDNTELVSKVNEGLAEIKKSGRYQEINRKWFGDNAEGLIIQ